MGYYINPTNESKEAFAKRQKEISRKEFCSFDFTDKKFLPICLVDNGFFRALGIAYSQREAAEFTRPSDTRPKQFFIASVEDLLKPETNADPGFMGRVK